MTRLRTSLLALTALLVLAPACTEEPEEFRAVSEWVDGMTIDSDDGAFLVVLSTEDGELSTGRNDLLIHIGFHDPTGRDADGRGIPHAELSVDAWMPNSAVEMPNTVEVQELGHGTYAVDNVTFEQPGVWNLDIEIRVGDGMYETVSLAFDIADSDGDDHDADQDHN